MKKINYKNISIVIDKTDKIKNTIDIIIFLIAVATTIIYKYRHVIKNLLLFINTNTDLVDIISETGILLCKYIIYAIIVYVIISIFYIFIRKFIIFKYRKKQYNRYKEFISNRVEDRDIKELYKNLYNYFSNQNNKTPIFIAGEWGAGKTYNIEKFIYDYYKYSKQNIYKISCFGITTKEALMKRISEACENEDTSFKNKIVSLIGEIPIVGMFLKSLLEKKYDINNIKENSIFIFDNFERIECSKFDGPVNTKTNNYKNAIIKYDIVAGTIDELIEKYNMKVVIIGNEKEMVKDYVYNTFICKLGCKKYTIAPSYKVFDDIWIEILHNNIILPEEHNMFLKILEEVKIASLLLWELSNNKNIRMLNKIIYNYVSFIITLKRNNYEFDENINEMVSIYYTNLIINLFGNEVVEKFREYESIGLHFEKAGMNSEKSNYFYLANVNAMWCSNSYMINLWKNLEQNYYGLSERILAYKQNYPREYISKKNCNSSDLCIEKIHFEDLICLLAFAKSNFINNAIKLLKNSEVIIDNAVDVAKLFEMCKIENTLKKNKKLLVSLFDCLYNNLETKSIIEIYNNTSNSFKRCNDKYKEIISNTSNK